MSGTLAATDARRALLARLIDHAALFPPASLALDDALAVDARARATDAAWMLGRFLVPASLLEALVARAAAGAAVPPGLGIVLDGAGRAAAQAWLGVLDADLARAAAAARAGLRVEATEVRLPGPELAAAGVARARDALGDDVAVWLEVALGTEVETRVAAVAAAGATGVKVRCGGTVAAAFPTVEALASVVRACRGAHVAFKATAGLHHPVRHVEPRTGFPMHGFLNLLAAATFADRADPADLLAITDPAAFALDADRFAVAGLEAGADALAQVRRERFAGLGSCSFAEPVEDLRALRIL